MVTSLSLLALAVASYEAEFLLALGAWVRVALIERNRRNGEKTITWVILSLSLSDREKWNGERRDINISRKVFCGSRRMDKMVRPPLAPSQKCEGKEKVSILNLGVR